MLKHRSTALIAAFALSLSACASIVGTKSENLSINSHPDQANVVVKTTTGTPVTSGKTPLSVSLTKGCGYFCGNDYIIEISKEGSSSQTFTIKTTPSGWYVAGNLVFGGLLGYLIIDPLTGAMWTLEKDQITIDLKTASTEGNLNITLLEDIPESARAKMRPVTN